MRRLNQCAFSLITAGLLAVAVVSPAAAADVIDVSATARGISIPSPLGPGQAPDIAYHGLAATNVSVGVETSGVPCGNCVKGGGEPNIGLPWPVFAVQSGSSLTISTWFQSTTYTGPCTAHIFVKQSDTIIDSGHYPFPGGCKAGYLFGVFFTVTAPSTTGFTTVIGTVSGGSNTSGADTFINVQ
jgi:hypothetical protein